MSEAVESGRGRWSAALGLSFAVLLLSVFDALAVVLLPLAVLVVALPMQERRARWIAVGVVLWLLGVTFSGGGLAALSRGWALMIGSTFLVLTLTRPSWDVMSRALGAAAISLAVGALALTMTGQIGELDATVRAHFASVSTFTVGDLQARMPDSAWVAELRAATDRIAGLQADLFPALLALQSLAALALASWWVRRLGRSQSDAFALARLRDFRFNDQLIWALIGSLALFLLPLGPVGDRVAVNGLVFMTALYALRGLAVFVFLATSSRSIPTMVLGALALVFLYPVALTAALLMGVGDTWLDVRRRAAGAAPT